MVSIPTWKLGSLVSLLSYVWREQAGFFVCWQMMTSEQCLLFNPCRNTAGIFLLVLLNQAYMSRSLPGAMCHCPKPLLFLGAARTQGSSLVHCPSWSSEEHSSTQLWAAQGEHSMKVEQTTLLGKGVAWFHIPLRHWVPVPTIRQQRTCLFSCWCLSLLPQLFFFQLKLLQILLNPLTFES